MFSSVYSAAVYGIDSKLIHVEVDVSDGLPCFDMVGYLSTQVKEAQNRVRTALKNSGIFLSPKRITVNLSPADLRKNGTGFDLPIAVAILSAYGVVSASFLENTLIVGELSLNGSIQFVPGVLAMAADARKQGCDCCIVPQVNENEAHMVSDIRVIPVKSLSQLVRFLQGIEEIHASGYTEHLSENERIKDKRNDFNDLYGQNMVKRAAMVAAAGFHNMLMIGPPGTGKSMIAKRIPGIMPDMTLEEQIEVSKIYSVMGMLPDNRGLIRERPFRSPHHTITPIGLTGGGLHPLPGELSLSHNGILFLDELPEFSRDSIEVLRQPLETKQIKIFRNGYDYVFPANMLLVAATNPCPCGYYPDYERCHCTASGIQKYLGKISYPLLDRIDLTVEVPEVKFEDMTIADTHILGTQEMKAMVEGARNIQRDRFAGTNTQYNAQIMTSDIDKYCEISDENKRLLKAAYEELKLSLRGLHKMVLISRTIADLKGSEKIKEEHLAEAFSYRAVRQSFW